MIDILAQVWTQDGVLQTPSHCQSSSLLRDLITCWQVCVEVVFPVEERHLVDVRPQHQTSLHSSLHTASVEDGERAGGGAVKIRYSGVHRRVVLMGGRTEYLTEGSMYVTSRNRVRLLEPYRPWQNSLESKDVKPAIFSKRSWLMIMRIGTMHYIDYYLVINPCSTWSRTSTVFFQLDVESP